MNTIKFAKLLSINHQYHCYYKSFSGPFFCCFHMSPFHCVTRYPLIRLNVLHVFCIYMQNQRRLGHCYELHFWISWEFYRPWSPKEAIPIKNRHCKLLSSFSSHRLYSLLNGLFKLFFGSTVHYTTCRGSAFWRRSLTSAFLKMVNGLYHRFNDP